MYNKGRVPKKKKLTHNLVLDIEPLMRETNFTLILSKNIYTCFCYISLHLPKIGQNLKSARHWDHYIKSFGNGIGGWDQV